jgi:hypothetical protein
MRWTVVYITVDMSSKTEPETPEYTKIAEAIRAYVRSLSFRERVRLSLEISRRPEKFNHYDDVRLELLKSLLDDPEAAVDSIKLQD